MSWQAVLIIAGSLVVSFVAGIYTGEHKRRTNHSARIWRNL